MYAIGFVNCGSAGMRKPMGNEGLQILHNKTMRGWSNELQIMKKCVDEIFIMRDFTQKMCEMSQAQLWEHCCRNNIARIKAL